MIRPAAHVTGDVGEASAKLLFLRAGWIVEDLDSEYGYDLLVQPAREGRVHQDIALVQVKTISSGCSPGEGQALRLKVSDLQHWAASHLPVFVIVVNLKNSAIYLLRAGKIEEWLRARFGDDWTSAKTRKIQVPESAKLFEAKLDELADELRSYWESMRHAREMANSTVWQTWGGNPYLMEVIQQDRSLVYEFGRDRARDLLRRAGIYPLEV